MGNEIVMSERERLGEVEIAVVGGGITGASLAWD